MKLLITFCLTLFPVAVVAPAARACSKPLTDAQGIVVKNDEVSRLYGLVLIELRAYLLDLPETHYWAGHGRQSVDVARVQAVSRLYYEITALALEEQIGRIVSYNENSLPPDRGLFDAVRLYLARTRQAADSP